MPVGGEGFLDGVRTHQGSRNQSLPAGVFVISEDDMSDEFLTLTEAAKQLGCSRMTMSRRVEEGQFSSFTDPMDRRRVLVRRDDIAAVLDARIQLREIPGKQLVAGAAAWRK